MHALGVELSKTKKIIIQNNNAAYIVVDQKQRCYQQTPLSPKKKSSKVKIYQTRNLNLQDIKVQKFLGLKKSSTAHTAANP